VSGTMVPGPTLACQPGGKDLPRSRFTSRPGGSPLVTMSSRSEWIASGFKCPAAISLQLLAGWGVLGSRCH
jgi:hypothetical protein